MASDDTRTVRVRRFAVGGCAAGATVAYASLAGLQALVAPIPPEIAVAAWVAPALAFAGVAAFFWYGPRLLVALTRR